MWTIEEVSPTVHKMRVQYVANQNWRWRILVTADEHIDHKDSDLNLIKKHMQMAQDGNYPNIKLGDLFCAMQSRNDPRRSRVANIHNDKDEYFDAIVDYAHDVIAPYADIYAFQAVGNHESSVLKNSDTHLLKRLKRRLNGSSPMQLGGYSGWIKILFETPVKNKRQSINIRYTHGSGGTAPVSKGVIKTNRRAVVFPDADIILSGHSHEAWVVPIARERLTDGCKLYRSEQLHVQIPSYKDEQLGKTHGFAVEKEFSPKPVGAYWLDFWFERADNKIHYDARRVH